MKPIIRNIDSFKLLIFPERQYDSSIYILKGVATVVVPLYLQGLQVNDIYTKIHTDRRRSARVSADIQHIHHIVQFLDSVMNNHSDSSTISDVTAFMSNELEDLDQYSISSNIPLYCGIEPTWKCNFKCHHCYIRTCDRQELSLKNWKMLLDSIADSGVVYLTITGGEPFLYEGFKELYRYAKSKGFVITIYTNGTLIDESLIELFTTLPPKRIEISIYGITQATYYKMTGIKNSYNNFLQGFNLLSQLRDRTEIALKTIIVKDNVTEYEKMRQFAEEYSLSLASNFVLWTRIDSNKANLLCQLSAQDIVRFEEKDPSISSSWNEYPNSTPISANQSDTISCYAGKTLFSVDCEGYAGYCIGYRSPHINLRTTPLPDVWEVMQRNREHFLAKPSKCKQCKYRSFCDFCPVCGVLQGGDKHSITSYMCDIAKNRFEYYAETSEHS